MNIRILRGTVINGKNVKPGQIIKASENDARYLISMEKAVAVTGNPVPVPAPAPALPKLPPKAPFEDKRKQLEAEEEARLEKEAAEKAEQEAAEKAEAEAIEKAKAEAEKIKKNSNPGGRNNSTRKSRSTRKK